MFVYLLGQTPLPFRLMEIRDAVEKGAKEIDIVLSRSHVMQGNWEEVKALFLLVKHDPFCNACLVVFDNRYTVDTLAIPVSMALILDYTP